MRYQQILCVLAGILPLAAIGLLSIIQPGFMLFRDYISGLGVGPYAALFNALLSISALLLVPFVLYIKDWKTASLLGSAAFFLALVGVFTSGSPLHFWVSAAFFLSAIGVMGLSTLKLKGKARYGAVIIVVLCLIGLAFFNPFIEVLEITVVCVWVAWFGLRYKG